MTRLNGPVDRPLTTTIPGKKAEGVEAGFRTVSQTGEISFQSGVILLLMVFLRKENNECSGMQRGGRRRLL